MIETRGLQFPLHEIPMTTLRTSDRLLKNRFRSLKDLYRLALKETQALLGLQNFILSSFDEALRLGFALLDAIC